MTFSPLLALALALVLSLAGNGFLGWAYLGQRDKATMAKNEIASVQGELDGARADASACSDATDDLRTQSNKRKLESEAARKAASARAQTHNKRADELLREPPPVPGDACASAQKRVDRWLAGRVKQ